MFFSSKYSVLVCMLNSVLEHASGFYAIQNKLLLLLNDFIHLQVHTCLHLLSPVLGLQWLSIISSILKRGICLKYFSL